HRLLSRPLDRDHHRADHRRPRYALRSDPRRLPADQPWRDHDQPHQLLGDRRAQAMVLRRRPSADRGAAPLGHLAVAPPRHRTGGERAMSAAPILEVRGLSKRFRGLQAVDGVSFSVPKGSIVALIGPNGAGKTTTFNLIAGAIRPDSGSVLLDGADVTGLRPDQACHAGIGRTFQLVKPFGALSVLQNVMVGALHATGNMREAREASWAILERLGLAERAETP